MRLLLFIVFLSSAVLAQTRHDVFIKLSSSDSLDATYFIPPPPMGNGRPAILFIHGFGLTKDDKIPSAEVYALNGYITLAYTVSGHGNSSGVSTIMSSSERSDLRAVLEYLKSLPKVDTVHIGIIGSSQGGLHGLWSIADRLPVHAVAADDIVPDWASDFFDNGSIRRTMLLLLQTKTVRYAPIRDSLWDLVRQNAYDSLRVRFSRGRDVERESLIHRTTPLLTLVKWQDHYFSPDGGINLFHDYEGQKKLYLGTGGHFSDTMANQSYVQSDLVFRWCKEFLFEQPTGILSEPAVTVAYSHLPMNEAGNFSWSDTSVSEWPLPSAVPVRLYLSTDSTLLFAPSSSVDDSVLLPNRYLNPAYTLDTAFVEGFRGNRFDALMPKATLSFQSDPITSDVLWAGTPRMKLFVRSDDAEFPLNAQIYEVDSAGTKYFINRINYTARHWLAGAGEWIEAEGIPHAHHFHRGSRIRIEITNIDKTNRLQLGTYPFVVPLFEDVSATIVLDGIHASYIELPLVGSPTSVVQVDDRMPQSFQLYPNYPNPFNLQTTIKYDITRRSRVVAVVYTQLGQQVQTLYDGVLDPGTYRLTWDAHAMSSGVYYYRFITTPLDGRTPFNGTGKMLLIR